MKFVCTIEKPMINFFDKKYIFLRLDPEISEMIKNTHLKNVKHVKRVLDPLNENVLKVKIPFRYNRVTCKVTGDKTAQELVQGDKITAEIEYCGWWENGEFGGPSWKFVSIEYRQE